MPHLNFQAIRDGITMWDVLQKACWQATISVKGGMRRGGCPLHGSTSRNPRSFCSTERGFFCHSCKRNGDVIDFWAAYRKLPLYDAALDLCWQFGIVPPRMPRR